jgi:phosphate transport system ATP-binding protein
MQQAARVSDMTAFLMVELTADERSRWGELIEYDDTSRVFTNPSDPRTEEYISGRVG